MCSPPPPCSRKHLLAVLDFRGLKRGREKQLILQRLADVKKQLGARGAGRRVLFSDMPVAANTDCLSNLPFSCFGLLS